MAEEISTEQLHDIIQLIRLRYGNDFSGYAEASLKRRLIKFCGEANVSVYDLKFHLTNERPFFFWLLESMTVNLTEMFRDPSFYKALVAEVLPVLATYPHIKIWHAGCATGEEAFSLAILLKEAGLLHRCKIYATDVNTSNIEKATTGILPLERMKEYTSNYIKAGGISDFSNYYTARYDQAIMGKELRDHILFSQHNLVTDYSFNEFHLICCRNVMIYFKRELQNRVINLFHQSLLPLGYLALGTRESLSFSDNERSFEIVNRGEKIFRLMA